MRCSQAKDLISLTMDERLEEYDRARLVEHLEACPECESHQDILTRGRELLGAGMQEPSENFEWKVQLAIQRELRGAVQRDVPVPVRGRFWLPAGLTTGMVAALVIVAGWLVLPAVLGSASAPPALDLTGGVRADFGDIAISPANPGIGHRVSGSRSGPLPGRDQSPFGIGTPLDYQTDLLLKEREAIRRELRRLQLENAALREAAAQSTLTPEAARGEQ